MKKNIYINWGDDDFPRSDSQENWLEILFWLHVLPATVTNIKQGMESECFKIKIVSEAFLFEKGFLLKNLLLHFFNEENTF